MLSQENWDNALKNNLESTFDEIRGLSIHRNDKIAKEASTCLIELIRQIGWSIRNAQNRLWMLYEDIDMFLYNAINYIWLISSCSFLPHWSVITLNYDEVLDNGFQTFLNWNMKPIPKQFILGKTSLIHIVEETN